MTQLGIVWWEVLEEILQRAEQLGGTVERARTELGGDDRWFAIVADPGGVSFGLWTENPLAGRAG
ncbi:MAG TPA: hypothetical protein VGI58_14975 [Streptosporangiaceae bacterium]|jgi:predicted enzyme related to lactoylglutathione lyase